VKNVVWGKIEEHPEEAEQTKNGWTISRSGARKTFILS